MIKKAKAKNLDLEKGDKIYFNGDRANASGVGTITEIKDDTYYENGKVYEVEFADGREMSLEGFNFSDHYAGNGSTRFVAYVEYMKWKRERIMNFIGVEEGEMNQAVAELMEQKNFKNIKITYYKDGLNAVELERKEEGRDNYFLIVTDKELKTIKKGL